MFSWIEDDSGDAGLIEAALDHAGGKPYRIERASRLSEALACLGKASFEIILLDLTLPDARGIAVFEQVFQAAPDAMIVILGASEDEEIARLAVQGGR